MKPLDVDALRARLSDGVTAKQAALYAKEVASDPSHAHDLPAIVAALADAIITPPKRSRGGQRKVTLGDQALPASKQQQLVEKRTHENVALSEYAHIVNARNIVDGRAPEYAAYGVEMDRDDAMRYLKARRLYRPNRSGFKALARKYVLQRPYARLITPDSFDKLKRRLAKHS